MVVGKDGLEGEVVVVHPHYGPGERSRKIHKYLSILNF